MHSGINNGIVTKSLPDMTDYVIVSLTCQAKWERSVSLKNLKETSTGMMNGLNESIPDRWDFLTTQRVVFLRDTASTFDIFTN